MDQPDVIIRNEGSIVLLEPQSDEAKEWIEEYIGQDNGYQPYWPTVVCEPRYVEDIMYGMFEYGLTLEVDGRLVVGMEPA